MSSELTNEYRTSVANAREYLDNAESLDAFLFAVSTEGDLNATMGWNDTTEPEVALDELVGITILLLAQTHDVHPAILGHGATEFAIENWEHSEAFDRWQASD
jgi:hypothetical protein